MLLSPIMQLLVLYYFDTQSNLYINIKFIQLSTVIIMFPMHNNTAPTFFSGVIQSRLIDQHFFHVSSKFYIVIINRI